MGLQASMHVYHVRSDFHHFSHISTSHRGKPFGGEIIWTLLVLMVPRYHQIMTYFMPKRAFSFPLSSAHCKAYGGNGVTWLVGFGGRPPTLKPLSCTDLGPVFLQHYWAEICEYFRWETVVYREILLFVNMCSTERRAPHYNGYYYDN
jgi:hypothetical protein